MARGKHAQLAAEARWETRGEHQQLGAQDGSPFQPTLAAHRRAIAVQPGSLHKGNAHGFLLVGNGGRAGRVPGVSSASPYLNPTFPGSGQNRPLAMSHRGFSLAGQENSMAAFRAAVELGFRYLETDVRATRDGVLMAFHDPTLERTTDGRGELTAHTAGQLAQLRISGEPIPTFEELLAAWPDVCLNVDVKDMAAADELARLIEAYAAHDRVLVASFSDRRRFRVLRGPQAAGRGLGRRICHRRNLSAGLRGDGKVPGAAAAGACRAGAGDSTAGSRWSRRDSSGGATAPASRCMCGPSTSAPRCSGCWHSAWTD